MEPVQLAQALAAALVDNKAQDVTVLDLAGVSDVFDAFVIVTGFSEGHRRALIEAAGRRFAELAAGRARLEGSEAAGWAVLDCAGVMVHVMSAELRDYYELEELWGDAPRIGGDSG